MPWERHGGEVEGDGEGKSGSGSGSGGGDMDEGKRHEGTSAKIEVTEAIAEWDYGDYEGVTSHEIAAQRKEKGEPEWDIWRDGCPGVEYVLYSQNQTHTHHLFSLQSSVSKKMFTT